MNQLVVAHYHLRPGGVRRVIETALPPIAGAGRMARVVLAVGEPPDPVWLHRLRASLAGTPLEVSVHPEFLYWSEQHATGMELLRSLEEICGRLLEDCGGAEAILWAHNLGLGRNIPLSRAWAEAARRRGSILVSHHHDFFFDNRWNRWPEMRNAGTASLAEAAETVFPTGGRFVHIVINRADLHCLEAGFGNHAVWMPNAVTPARHSDAEGKSLPAWMAARIGTEAPYWLLPCRLLRRKNIAESVLLARWLRPEARVVTTGAPTSCEEQDYAERLRESATRHGWNLDLSILAGVSSHPPISALIAKAEAVLLTSLQEGFGLPYLEAASGARPLLARNLPNVLPDLVSIGLHAPLAYREVLVPSDAFDSKREAIQQRRLWNNWVADLPAEAREFCDEPVFLQRPDDPVPFSRLSFAAQEEILARPAADMDSILSTLNPELADLRKCAGEFPPSTLDASGSETLSPARFAENFRAAVQSASSSSPIPPEAPLRALRAFLQDRLASQNLYPLLFSTDL